MNPDRWAWTLGSRPIRPRLSSPSVKGSTKFWGQNEVVWTIGGSFVYRLLGSGTRYGTKVVTKTVASAYLDPVEAATSGGRD